LAILLFLLVCIASFIFLFLQLYFQVQSLKSSSRHDMPLESDHGALLEKRANLFTMIGYLKKYKHGDVISTPSKKDSLWHLVGGCLAVLFGFEQVSLYFVGATVKTRFPHGKSALHVIMFLEFIAAICTIAAFAMVLCSAGHMLSVWNAANMALNPDNVCIVHTRARKLANKSTSED